MRQFKGYSLIELLVTMFIMLMVISAVYLTYTSLLKGYKREGGIGGNIVSEQSALELIRRDIVLAGLGISADVTPLLMSGIDDNVTITFRTTQNPSSDKSFGYLVLRFDNNTNSWVVLADKRIDNTVNRIIVIDSTRKRWTLDNLTASKIPQSSPYP
ncbi:MAG: prepilin-type N-terminal cleavage/methylation domain-containing protein, partial [Deferribacterales bacterium]